MFVRCVPLLYLLTHASFELKIEWRATNFCSFPCYLFLSFFLFPPFSPYGVVKERAERKLFLGCKENELFSSQGRREKGSNKLKLPLNRMNCLAEL